MIKPTDESPLNKLAEMVQGKLVIMSDRDLDLLCPFDLSNLVRSKPNPNQVGTKDQWECWIERRDLARFAEKRSPVDLKGGGEVRMITLYLMGDTSQPTHIDQGLVIGHNLVCGRDVATDTRPVVCYDYQEKDISTQDMRMGQAWRENSSLEKWFPFTAQELRDLKSRLEKATVALGIIEKSSRVDFETSLEWGQWCRDVAIETLANLSHQEPPSPSIAALDRQANYEREQRLTDGEAW